MRASRIPHTSTRGPARRCKSGGTQRVSLPPGYLDDRDDDRPLFPDPLDAGSGG